MEEIPKVVDKQGHKGMAKIFNRQIKCKSCGKRFILQQIGGKREYCDKCRIRLKIPIWNPKNKKQGGK